MFFGRTSLDMTLFAVLFLLFACASPKAPSGGPDDVTPPAIIEAESTPNFQTYFQEDEIVLTFDEWVTIKDVHNQMIISPLLPAKPDIRQKGKSIIITLPDSLQEETTYSINFGNSIADLNAGNALSNYSFVFSTGEALDSIQLSGTVLDAVSLQPVPDIWVMLHPAGIDSAVYLFKPMYLAKTDTKGKWTISNIKVGTFEVMALKDANLNYIYDQEAELFGWLDSLVITDHSSTLPPIMVFPRAGRSGLSEVIHPAPGSLRLIIRDPLPKPFPSFLPELDTIATQWYGDTLQIWYGPDLNYTGIAVLGGDTTRIKASGDVALPPVTIAQVYARIHPAASVTYRANLPVQNFDPSQIRVSHDSLGTAAFTIERLANDRRTFLIKAPWKNETRYRIDFFPGAVTDILGRANDTIVHSVVVTSPDLYGDLSLIVDGMDSTHQYIIILKGEKSAEQILTSGHKRIVIDRKSIEPGKYSVEMIEDLNRNGMWDTGNYERRQQPERKKFFMPETLRAGWELEIKMTWK